MGSSPPCQKTNSSRLIPGVVDYPHAPVEPAPRTWSSLRARLVLPRVVHPGVIAASVVLTNSATEPVSLAAPCPTYAIGVMIPLNPTGGYGGNLEQTGGRAGDFCSAGVAVSGHGSVTLKLQPLHVPAEDPRNPWMKGALLSMDWAMAGVPTAHATALIG
jgi:hypothetical protein